MPCVISAEYGFGLLIFGNVRQHADVQQTVIEHEDAVDFRVPSALFAAPPAR